MSYVLLVTRVISYRTRQGALSANMMIYRQQQILIFSFFDKSLCKFTFDPVVKHQFKETYTPVNSLLKRVVVMAG